VENILGFADQYTPAAEVISLQRNYRSAQAILDTANHLIAESDRQYRKDLYSEDKPGAMPRYVTVEDSDAEVDYVVDAVLQNRESGMRLMDQAVLFRGSHHSDRLEPQVSRSRACQGCAVGVEVGGECKKRSRCFSRPQAFAGDGPRVCIEVFRSFAKW
jgi:superfamily I DNA/RNA helicase